MSADPRDQALVWIWRCSQFLLLAMLVCQAQAYGQPGPQPPCGTNPVPAYPGLDDSAIVKLWSKPLLCSDWKPPACTGWTAAGFITLVTSIARFRYTSKAEGLLRHIGAISELADHRGFATTVSGWV